MEKQADALFRLIAEHSSDDCLIWPFALHFKGYGVLRFRGRTTKAHRVAFEHVYGNLAEGEVVRHTCDDRRCFNPRHLLKGTHADNVADMVNRGRSCTGVNHPHSKLTPEQVREIYLSYESPKKLSEAFGVSASVISGIQVGSGWHHFTRDLPPRAHVPRGREITHCPHGHEYTPANTLIYNGCRSCRECRTIGCREYQRRRRAKAREERQRQPP